jgi:hypothetical protein
LYRIHNFKRPRSDHVLTDELRALFPQASSASISAQRIRRGLPNVAIRGVLPLRQDLPPMVGPAAAPVLTLMRTDGAWAGLATRQYSLYMQVMAQWNLAKPLARSRRAETAATAMAASNHERLAQFGTLGPRDLRYVARVRRLSEHQLGRPATASLWPGAERLGLADAVKSVFDEVPGRA